jgi:chromosome segregation ATPase
MNKDYNRKRMAYWRKFVKKFVKQGHKDFNHMGEVPDNMADARRIIVALQDELERSQTRHRKATQRYMDLAGMTDGIINVAEATIDKLIHENQYKAKVNQELQGQIKHLDEKSDHIHDQLVKMTKERDKLLETLHEEEFKLNAALVTVKTVMTTGE